MESRFPLPSRWRMMSVVLVAALACFRFAHLHLLWSDEDYHLAAAIQMLHGRMPYRDFWYDKPPLSAIYYLLIGGHYGWPLRVLDALYVCLACYLAYRLARCWWSEWEGIAAALLLAFFTTFYLPAAVIPLAADALMVIPHLAAVYCAARKRALCAGIWAGVGFWVNPKAVFVLAVCGIWLWPQLLALITGFAIPLAAGLVWLLISGGWFGYVEQVWRWGLLYASGSPAIHPLRLGLIRIADWLGFHAALALAAIFAFFRLPRDKEWKLGSWLVLSFAGVCIGARFVPRYFFELLLVMVVMASRGIAMALRERPRLAAAVLAVALITPVARFGPRYAMLAYDDIIGRDPNWADVGMDLDSQKAARKLRSLAHPGDTLFVWGYRPDIYVYSRLVPSGLFWDSQPLTGVPADRHLFAVTPIYSYEAATNREKLIRFRPTFVVDGLSLLNPKLKPSIYSELWAWLADYRLVAETKSCLIYRRED